jgi:polar amino acid transport system substrate-binding protein
MMTAMSADARAELAPNRKLRAGLNYSNFLLVMKRTPTHEGVAPDIARELARRAGAEVEFVGYDNAGLVADAAAHEAWDVAFIGAEPARADRISFTAAYVEIEATYLLPAGSPIKSLEDVDKPGVRIATTARAAYTLFLERSIKHATLVQPEGLQGSFDTFVRDKLEVLAGLKPRLLQDLEKLPGSRLVEGRFTAVQQAMAAPKKRSAAYEYLLAFAEEIKANGFVAGLIDKHNARGLSVAPASKP